MRPFSSRMFPNVVQVATRSVTGRSGGADVKTLGDPVDRPASVQPNKANRWSPMQGAQRSEVDWVVYFQSDPGVKVNDSITWGTRKLIPLGPAKPEAGRDALWSVDCKETR